MGVGTGGTSLGVGPSLLEKLVGISPLETRTAGQIVGGAARLASRICSTPGCPRIHDGATGSRCPDHAKTADRAHWARTKGYNTKAHRVTFRLAVLQKDPICVLCQLAVSTVADHYPKSREDLIALAMNPNDPRHGRGLCEPCHNTETARNQPGGWNTRD